MPNYLVETYLARGAAGERLRNARIAASSASRPIIAVVIGPLRSAASARSYPSTSRTVATERQATNPSVEVVAAKELRDDVEAMAV